MNLDTFFVSILEGTETAGGYVEMQHAQQYTIQLGNRSYDRRCDAEVKIDGKVIGSFRLDKGRTITLERPLDDSGRFTFYKADTVDGAMAGAGNVNTNNRGLIEVTFKPEMYVAPVVQPKPAVPYYSGQHTNCSRSRGLNSAGGTQGQMFAAPAGGGAPTNSCTDFDSAEYSTKATLCSASPNASAGVTGLSGHSYQRFVTVADLNYDMSLARTITLRLVHGGTKPCCNTPRELKPAAMCCTPVPPAV